MDGVIMLCISMYIIYRNAKLNPVTELDTMNDGRVTMLNPDFYEDLHAWEELYKSIDGGRIC